MVTLSLWSKPEHVGRKGLLLIIMRKLWQKLGKLLVKQEHLVTLAKWNLGKCFVVFFFSPFIFSRRLFPLRRVEPVSSCQLGKALYVENWVDWPHVSDVLPGCFNSLSRPVPEQPGWPAFDPTVPDGLSIRVALFFPHLRPGTFPEPGKPSQHKDRTGGF